MSRLLEDGPIRRILKGERILPKLLPQEVRGIDSGLETMKDAKRREWSSRGYPPGLIDKATRLADEWSRSLGEAFAPPELRDAVIRHVYPKGLDVADRWIKKISGEV